MIKQEFIPYAEARHLKELGFNEPCLGYWSQKEELKINDEFVTEFSQKLKAPLYQQAFRWFRKNYELEAWVCAPEDLDDSYEYEITHPLGWDGEEDFDSWEEAEIACLKKLIEMAKKRKL